MTPLTKIAELRALCEKATDDLPARLHAGYLPKSDYPHLVTSGDGNETTIARFASADEARRWVAAINALPALLAVAEAAEEMRAFIGIMCGKGPNAVIPVEVRSPIGVPIKIGNICEDADTALAQLAKEAQ